MLGEGAGIGDADILPSRSPTASKMGAPPRKENSPWKAIPNKESANRAMTGKPKVNWPFDLWVLCEALDLPSPGPALFVTPPFSVIFASVLSAPRSMVPGLICFRIKFPFSSGYGYSSSPRSQPISVTTSFGRVIVNCSFLRWIMTINIHREEGVQGLIFAPF